MLSYDKFIETINIHFPIKKISQNGKHVLTRCVFCGDSKKNSRKMRLNIEFESKNPKYPGQTIYRCFNCDASGSFTKLYAFLNHISEEDAKSILYNYNPEDIRKRLSKDKSTSEKEEKKKYVFDYVLKDCVSLSTKSTSMVINSYIDILREFKESRYLPEDFRIFFATKGDFRGRIILPIFENGHVVYFQARSLDPNAERKYINPVAEKESIILNMERFDSTKPIVVVEGIIDALSLGNNATTILGASLSDEFVEKIKDKGSEIIVVCDNDERGQKELRKILSHSKYSHQLKYFIMPEKYKYLKDMNDLLCREFKNINNLYNFVVENSYSKIKTLVKLKIGR